MVKSSSSNKVLDTSNSSIPLPNTITKHQPKDESIRKRQYKGVRMRSWGSWVSEIRAPHQKTRIWLGSYSTPEAAARAYDAALLCLKGSSAALNFPTSLPYHPPNTVMSPKSIQRVAAAAAATAAAAAAAAAAHAVTPTTSTISPATTPSPSSRYSPSDATEDSPSTTTTSSNSCMVNTIEDESWIDFGAFHSPKFTDQMISSWEELDDEGDFKLWSFC